MMAQQRAMLLLFSLAAVVATTMPCAGQEPLAGPAAAVITTPELQQAWVATVSPQTIQPYTMEMRLGRPVVVYENGRSFPLEPMDEFIENHRERDGQMETMAVQSDPPEFVDRDYSDMPDSAFVHVKQYQTPVRDQGDRGFCHVFAATALLESLIKGRMMRKGVPEQFAEIDLSEEWLAYHSMIDKCERFKASEVSGESGDMQLDLCALVDKACPTEVFWPYDTECWCERDPDTDPAAADYADNDKAACEWWAHREPGQKTPASIGLFRGLIAPDGPLPFVTIQADSPRWECDVDAALEVARSEIADGRAVGLSLSWPSLRLTNAALTMYCVTDDYPEQLRNEIAAGQQLTDGQQKKWDKYYIGGHSVLLIGYGRDGGDCEGIWMFKNSHGLNSGNNGIVYITESLLRLSFPAVCMTNLSASTRADIDRFADTMLQQLDR